MSDTTESTMNTNLPAGCGCAACSAGMNTDPVTSYDYDEQSATSTGYDYSDVDYSDGTLEDAVDSLYSGSQWATTTLTFSFTDSASDYSYNWGGSGVNGIVEFTSDQKESVRYIYDMIESFSGLTFTELTGANDANADLTHAHSSDPGTAFAYYPSSGDWGGDAFYGGSFSSDTQEPLIGTYIFDTIMHEMGHTLGLKHGHETTGAGATPVSYRGQEYSIMTYLTDETDTAADGITVGSSSYAQSFMMLDIAALQQMYGANFNYNSGDTTYTFSTTTGAMYIDGVDYAAAANVDKSGNVIFRTIWDGDGVDTYDFSNFTTDLSIDLTPGSYVDLDVGGNSQRSLLDWRDGDYADGHVYNALQFNEDTRSLIENAVGGSGDDTFIGNIADNILTGNAGNDTFYGSSGDDTIDGGNDSDTAIYSSYDITDFLVLLVDTVTLSFQHIADTWTDTISNVETFIFNGTSYSFAEAAEYDQSAQPEIRTKINWTGGAYAFDSDILGTTTLADSTIGFNGASGNLIRFTRSTDDLNIRMLNSDAPGDLDITGSDQDDTILLTGTHSNIDVNLSAGDGNDVISIASTITGNVVIFGDGGNDTITGSTGFDGIRGGTGADTINALDGDDKLWGEDGDDIINGGAGADTIYGGAGTDTIDGGDDDDLIKGGDDADTIDGGAGDDDLFGEAGDDIITGGEGDDVINGWNGNDTAVYASALSNYVFTFQDADTVLVEDIVGNDGADTLSSIENFTFNGVAYTRAELEVAGASKYLDSIKTMVDLGASKYFHFSELRGDTTVTAAEMGYGGASGDMMSFSRTTDSLTISMLDASADRDVNITGSTANDTIILNGTHTTMNAKIYGGDGDDSITITDVTGNFVIFGDAGNDTINGSSTFDGIRGGTGDDIINAGDGNDKVWGEADNDTIHGDAGNDTLYGDGGNDILYGDAGIDYLYGGTGNDTIYGGDEFDRILGEDGDDTIYGDGGDDVIVGGIGADILHGGAGNDELKGGDDNDILYAEDGTDWLYGEGGADTFVFQSLDADAYDQIRDFSIADGDKLNITDLLSGYTHGQDDINDFLIMNSKSSNVTNFIVSTDGSGDDFTAFVKVVGSDFTSLSVDDLISNGTLVVDQSL